MKKKVDVKRSRTKSILLTIGAVFVVVFIIVPLALGVFNGEKIGNVALIPIEGPITGNGGKVLGANSVSSQNIVAFIKAAEENPQVQVIVLEINSPGGGAVASDEIATAVKDARKPVVSVIREVGASGGYWVASATEYIVANRMSITGSIGVISSYLEFSGLMSEYGIGYERLVAGERKDSGTPFKKLSSEERAILQKKLDTIHDFFIKEVAQNRKLSETKVREIATGEFYLGVEALNLGLVDQLGDKKTLEEYLKRTYDLQEVDYVTYQHEPGFFEALAGVFSEMSFNVGEGIGTVFAAQNRVEIGLY